MLPLKGNKQPQERSQPIAWVLLQTSLRRKNWRSKACDQKEGRFEGEIQTLFPEPPIEHEVTALDTPHLKKKKCRRRATLTYQPEFIALLKTVKEEKDENPSAEGDKFSPPSPTTVKLLNDIQRRGHTMIREVADGFEGAYGQN